METLYEIFRRRHEAGVPFPPSTLLGFTLEHFEPGFARVSMEVKPEHFNPMGTVHGGIFCDLGDMAMGIAYFCTLPAGEAMTTIELKINYLRPLTQGRAVAEARVVNKSRSLGLIECDIFDHAGKLAARLSSTCYVLRGEKAEERIRFLAGE
jgi:uncharacterized protein (TIGR00369 family)